MKISPLRVPVFLPRTELADRAIARADLLAKLRRCRTVIDLIKRRHVDELNAAAIDLANAHDELEAFICGQGRART